MSIIVPNISEILILGLLLNKNLNSQNQVLRLFKNSYVPNENTTLNDLQEADQQGYSPITLSPENWTISQIAGNTTAVCAEKEFIFGESATIYGYYITTSHQQPLLLWVERFSSGDNNQYFDLPSSGGSIKIVPKISLS